MTVLTAPTRCPRGWGLYVQWLCANDETKAAIKAARQTALEKGEVTDPEPIESAASRTLAYKEALAAYRAHMKQCPACKSYIARLEQQNARNG